MALAPPPDGPVAQGSVKRPGDLAPRVASAVVMMSLGMAAAWFGGWAWALAGAIVLGLAAREWCRMAGASGRELWIAVGAAALSGVLFVVGKGLQPVLAALVLLLAVGRAVAPRGPVAWMGTLYLAMGGWALAGIRLDDADAGRILIFGLFAVVWATDSAAYGVGRALGGPRLMPVASPNKTWSGFMGGAVAGTAAGALYAVLTQGSPLHWGAAGFVLSLAAQGGDILESLAKRHFGVKDSSGLIPGHGGLLDRLDGHFSAALLLAVGILVWPPLLDGLT
jgi:phosphatidate cytidylyltransferase